MGAYAAQAPGGLRWPMGAYAVQWFSRSGYGSFTIKTLKKLLPIALAERSETIYRDETLHQPSDDGDDEVERRPIPTIVISRKTSKAKSILKRFLTLSRPTTH